ncbi:MAG: UvrD-helicase domain-containing protein, partial [Candidatus Omnitrophica bacterium]|nr:UvrD-helicase domain-containing protein [Candidatus Omnitrophota bacterium]
MKGDSINFISAGAGSGKTTRLTQILMEKLAGKEAAPNGIIATTFTNKAAAELKERVRAMLLQQDRQDLAVSIFEAQIGTVNNVCGGLLRRFAFEMGLSIEQQVLDECAAKEHLARAIDSVVSADGLAEVTDLAQRFGNVKRQNGEPAWQDDIKAVIDHARYNNIDPREFAEFARKNADELLALFPQPADDRLEERVRSEISRTQPIIEKGYSIKPQKNTSAYLDLLRKFDRSLQNGRFTWNEWLNMAKAKPAKALHDATVRLDAVCRQVVMHPRLQWDIRRYLEIIFSIAEKALVIYQEQKRLSGFVDFADQEAMLLEGLDNSSVRKRLQEKLDLLLVD